MQHKAAEAAHVLNILLIGCDPLRHVVPHRYNLQTRLQVLPTSAIGSSAGRHDYDEAVRCRALGLAFTLSPDHQRTPKT
eukprot:6181234-Pleurochrysis_carterae.AAC.1